MSKKMLSLKTRRAGIGLSLLVAVVPVLMRRRHRLLLKSMQKRLF